MFGFCAPLFLHPKLQLAAWVLGCDTDAFGEKSPKGWQGLGTRVRCPLGSHRP